MGSRLEQKSSLVRKRIEQHEFASEEGEEYEGSAFGGFPEYFRRKKIKLQNLDANLRANSTKPQIFKGIVCNVNGYTQPSLQDLHHMIVEYGGGFVQYLDGKTMVTHIIASNLTPKKKEEFRRYRIVKPAWIVDSIQAGHLLPWDGYRVIDEGVGQKVLAFDEGKVVSQVGKRTAGYREQSESSWYTRKLNDSGQPSSSKLNESFGNNSIGDEDLLLLEDIDEQPPSPAAEPGIPTEKSADAEDDNPNEAAQSMLQPREGSQEPDYAMAVIANSDIMKSVPPERLEQMTAEEHNALLLSDPKIRKSTVVHPDFLEQYYRESRLHHLSTWKADLKSQLQAITDKHAKPKGKRLTGQRRYIMHVDFDCFFASVSLINHPHLMDKPAVVAHGGGSGSEIASCNYPARQFGVKNGMWMRRAQELCPDLSILPYDFPAYEQASRHLYDAIMSTGGIVQSVSIDEALVEISEICFEAAGTDGVKRHEGGVDQEQQAADDIAQALRDEVLRTTQCNVSVGIGGNILLAKAALRKAKPAGQYHLKPEDVLDFLGELEVQALPGVAWSIGGKLEDIGIKLVKDVRECTRERLINTLGPKTGEKIWDFARGIDRTEVGDQVVRKSVSAEVNWGVRFETQEQVDEFMGGLCTELHKRLLREGVKGKQLTMKVMRRAADAPLAPPKHLGHGKCDTYNKSLQLGVATNEPMVITKEAITLIKSFGISPGELRGIGIQMQKLEPLRSSETGKLMSSQKRLQFKQPLLRDGPTSIVESIKPSGLNRSSLATSADDKPLNIAGTQFIMPTQVDPAVLRELPEDIRRKLMKAPVPEPSALPSAGNEFNIPSASQIDQDALSALPKDIQDEIRALHASPKKVRQTALPQSPRKTRPEAMPAKRKKGAGSSSLQSRLRSARSTTTLMQSNFIAMQSARDDSSSTPVEEIDESFLAELPEDIRKEVLAQQRQLRLQRTGGIAMQQKPRALQKRNTKSVERLIRLPPVLPAPTFTSAKLSTPSDLRNAVRDWVEEFCEDGPFEDDVKALRNYIEQVVGIEKDIEKAVAISRWLRWVVETKTGDNLLHWQRAVETVEEGVQRAAALRGLGKVRFE